MQYTKAVLNALKVNMGYREGEKVGIVMQKPPAHTPEKIAEKFKKSEKLCLTMAEIFEKNEIDCKILDYTVKELRNGANATKELYDKTDYFDILFMPVVFSLTHTPFRKKQTEKGTRIASMPGFTLEMFEENGPMDADYQKIHKQTSKIAEKLSKSRFVKVKAEETDITVEIMSETAHVSSGLLNYKGAYGNLPGAEAYAVPVHKGKSNGYFTVKPGWGGQFPLKHKATFFVKNGVITEIKGETEEAQKYIDENIKPLVFGGENFNILAELGIGTNPNITEEYIRKHGWSTLIAEKIYGSAHFANGNSFGMGGKNNVPIHIDWVVPNVKIEFLL